MIILAIETSCDETAASLIEASERGIVVKSNIVSSQINIHRQYGGIVPEVAARAHIEKILPVLKQAIATSGIKHPESSIQLVTVTHGPGLVTSLLVGLETAKILSYVWQKPLMPINHLIGHIYACLASNSQFPILNFQFPAVCLVVSGGHTELVLMENHHQFKKIGQTLDDAAGECFDKVAKLLNIGYPGGPAIARYAKLSSIRNLVSSIQLPRPMINTKDYNFSFSGLKTAVLYKTRKLGKSPTRQYIPEICREVQQAIIDVLVAKTLRAARDFSAKTVILCGGVAANDELRGQLGQKLKTKNPKLHFLVPPKNLCTDNAAMIAVAAYFQYQHLSAKEKNKLKNNWQKIEPDPNLEII